MAAVDPEVVKARQSAWVEESIERWSPVLRDRVAVVTGGARGLGQGIVNGLVQAGVKVAVVDKSWDGAEAFQKELEADGHLAIACDVTDDEQLDQTYSTVMERFGTTDILFNNAALVTETLWPPYGHKVTLDTTDRDWQVMFDVNVFGVLKITRRFIQPMIDQGRGSIINTLSSGVVMVAGGGGWFGLRPQMPEMPYQATKAAAMVMGWYLAAETKDQGIALNAFMPGHTRASWFDETARAYAKEGRPYGLRPCIPEHVLPLVLFLAAQDGSGVSGMVYSVPDWNFDHGYGDYRAWLDHDLPPDLEEIASQVEQMMANMAPPMMGLNTPAMKLF